MVHSSCGFYLEKDTMLETTGLTDVGPVRDHNEDSVAIIHETDHGIPGKGTILIVADGMGGMDAGDLASTMVTRELPALYLGSTSSDPAACLKESLLEMNTRVHEEGKRSPGVRAMGTTTVASVIVRNMLYTANLGDSRAYLYRDGRLTQLSKDHTMRNDFANPFESGMQDLSFVLTQAVGPQANVKPHLDVRAVTAGDMILLCSDGLTSVVSDKEIEEVLSSYAPDEVARELLARVVENDGQDNVSIIISRVAPVSEFADGEVSV